MVERFEVARRAALLVCRDRFEYAAAIAERRELEARLGQTFVPVIGRDARAEPTEMISYEPVQPLAELSDRELLDVSTERPDPNVVERGVCAYVTGDAPGWLCAAAFAAFSHRRLVPLERPRAEEDATRASSVTVVVSSALLTEKGTDWIVHRVRALFPEAPPFGILTARDERELSVFVARCLRRVPPPRGIAEVAWVPETKPYGLDDDGRALVPDMRAMPAPKAGAQVLFFRGHSREYCGQSGRLCSRPLWSDEPRACVRGLECVADAWARTPARDVRSDVVFLDSCMGGRFPGSLEPFQNVTTQLIEAGTSAVFTSAGRSYVDELTPLLSLRLMASGWTFGEIARFLNRFQRQRYGTVDCILLFGDPEGVPFSDRTTLPELKVHASLASAPGEARFRIPAPIASDAEVFLVRRAASMVSDGPYSCYRHPAHPEGMRALLLGLDDRHAAMIVLDGRGAAGDFVFHRRPPVDFATISAASQLVERVTLLPTADDEVLQKSTSDLGQMLRTRASVAGAARLGSASMQETAELAHYEENVARAAGDLAVQHARACREAITFGGWLDTLYLERGQMDMLPETFGSSTCPTCGLPLLACRYRVFGGRTEDRERRECERCGVVCDVLIGTPHVWLEAPAEICLGERFQARVRGTNATDLPVFLGADAIVAYVDPSKCEIEIGSRAGADSFSRVGPGESFTVTFDCRVDPAVRAHAYDLRAILSMNGDLALANRRVVYRRG